MVGEAMHRHLCVDTIASVLPLKNVRGDK